MKRQQLRSVFALVFFSLMPLVSASSHAVATLTEGVQQIVDFIREGSKPILEAIIGDYSTSEFFFAKTLVLILFFVVIRGILTKVPVFKDNTFVCVVISLVVSILAVRYISENQLTLGILLPYGVFGVVMSIMIPAGLIFFTMHFMNFGGAGRRLIWGIVFMVYLVLWLSRSSEFNSILNWIYFGLLVLMLFALWQDKGIHAYFKGWELRAFYRGAADRTTAALQAEYLQIINVDTPEAERRRHAIEVRLYRMGRTVP